jgi:curli production assembly/transport component CsgF
MLSRIFNGQAIQCLTTLLVATLVCGPVVAGELVYVPTNPTFGGNPSNAAGLQAAASAQNDYKAPSTTKAQTALEKFTASVQSAVLSRLSRNAVDGIFDPASGDPVLNTPVTVGNFTVTFSQEADSKNLIMITKDNVNGGETRITVGSVD